jgi:outer membrane protein insertion porin family
VNPYLPSNSVSQTLSSILHDARAVGHLLNETDLFSSVLAKVEPSRDPLGQPGDVDLVFKTREKSRILLKTSSEIGNNEGGAVSITEFKEQLQARLIYCRAQRVEFGMHLVAQKHLKPILPSEPLRVLHTTRP